MFTDNVCYSDEERKYAATKKSINFEKCLSTWTVVDEVRALQADRMSHDEVIRDFWAQCGPEGPSNGLNKHEKLSENINLQAHKKNKKMSEKEIEKNFPNEQIHTEPLWNSSPIPRNEIAN